MPDTERFQSTPSLRRATAIIIEGPLRLQVSIHALLAESDPWRSSASINHQRFNPRPPCGERQEGMEFSWHDFLFQSTPSLRRATAVSTYENALDEVSIHALLAESDENQGSFRHVLTSFNPRPPCGERLPFLAVNAGGGSVSIHALLAESDCRKAAPFITPSVSIHALLAESDCPNGTCC